MYVSINECLNEDNGTRKRWNWGNTSVGLWIFLFTFIDKILRERTQNSFIMKVQWQERKGTIIWIVSIFLSVAQPDQNFWDLAPFSVKAWQSSQKFLLRGIFFFLLTSVYLFGAKETRLEMTAWEELGQVFLCDKQYPYRDVIACFFQNQMQTQFKHKSAI